jgi:FMN phosphatase YigB (HAD superfamily)
MAPLPMPEPTVPPLPLGEYKVLSFDVYGTLIEYKAHILESFRPLLGRLPPGSPYLDDTPLSSASQIPDMASVGDVEFLKLFQRHEDKIKLERPVKRFDELLTEIYRRIARELQVFPDDEAEEAEKEARHFGSEATIAGWPTFAGTVEALKKLSQHYRLVALSNIDRYAWGITSSSGKSGLGEVDWWKVFTAEDFGGDGNADEVKLETLIEYCNEQAIDKRHILHVAQSLGHDQAPAKRLGLSSVWLIGDGPRWGKEAESKMALDKKLVGYAWRLDDLQQFAQEVERVLSSDEPASR